MEQKVLENGKYFERSLSQNKKEKLRQHGNLHLRELRRVTCALLQIGQTKCKPCSAV